MNDLNNYDLYRKDAMRYPLLTKEEEKELLEKAHAGDKSARDRLVNCNQRLVLKIVYDYVNKGVDIMELIQQANLGLLYAIDRYDADRSNALSTFATIGIKREIRKYFYNSNRTIRLPQWQQEVNSALIEARKRLRYELGRTPTNEELAEDLGVAVETIEHINADNAVSLISLETPLNEDGDTVMDLVPAPEEAPTNLAKQRKAIEIALKHLEPEEAELLERLFGLNGRPETTARQIGKERGISHQQALNKKNEILAKLRYPDILQQIRKEL